MKDLLADYPVVLEINLAWGEMDAFQHLNNTVYFRYFESTRIAYFEKTGFDRTMKESGIGPILASTQCRFRIPLSYPDTVSAATRVRDIGDDRFTMDYTIVSHRHRKIAADGEGLIVVFDYKKQRKCLLTDDIRKRIGEVEGGIGK